MKRHGICVILLILITSVSAQTLTQISTIDALLCGVYDGTTTIETLLEKGSFGIGTLNGLDGELVVWNDQAYQVTVEGVVNSVHPKSLTPFANVTTFDPSATTRFSGENYDALRTAVLEWIPSPNLFYALHIHGTFPHVKTRSVPRQSKPYPPLAEVVKTQAVFEKTNVTGHVLGFYCPAYVKGINVPGFHLHFLADNLDFGGHILDLSVNDLVIERMDIHDFRMFLPKKGRFFTTNLSEDRSKELKKVEGE